MNKKVTLKDIAIMQSGIYMKTDSQGEVRYLQVKDAPISAYSMKGQNEVL